MVQCLAVSSPAFKTLVRCLTLWEHLVITRPVVTSVILGIGTNEVKSVARPFRAISRKLRDSIVRVTLRFNSLVSLVLDCD